MTPGTPFSQLPISSSSQMVETYNGEVFTFTMSIQHVVSITLDINP